MKRLTIHDLSAKDIGRRVQFPRPASEPSGRKRVSGKLIAVQDEGLKGSRSVTVDHNGKGNIETFGPLPSKFPIDVGGVWVERREPDLEPEPYFPEGVRTIRAQLLAGPFDGDRIELDASEFEWDPTIYRTDPNNERIALTYDPLTPIYLKDHGLAVGKWGLVRSSDYDNQTEETFRWEKAPDAGLIVDDDTPTV